MKYLIFIAVILCSLFALNSSIEASETFSEAKTVFPTPIESYDDAGNKDIVDILVKRAKKEPFNVVAFLIFILAIIHTFLSSKFHSISNRLEQKFNEKQRSGEVSENSIPLGAGALKFLGELEAIFGIWAIVLMAAIALFHDWNTAVDYVGNKVSYVEPMFVVIIMTLASTRPILKLFELFMWKIANLLGGSLEAWWITILTVGPIMGSFITEPAAMTISAFLLADKFYDLKPNPKLKYGTIALLFVNISVGGTLTNFAAPPVLMVAGPWNWGLTFMFTNFGWKAFIGILISNLLFFYFCRHDLKKLESAYRSNQFKKYIQRRFIDKVELEERLNKVEFEVDELKGFSKSFLRVCDVIKMEMRHKALSHLSQKEKKIFDVNEALDQRFEQIKKDELKKSLPGLLPKSERPHYRDPNWDCRDEFVPTWMMVCHAVLMVWTVINVHYPALFIGGFLFFLGFAQVTAKFQNRINLKPAILVGFFLSGLVIHGGVQAWWIEPVIANLDQLPLTLGATVLTAFNDNAAITYLSTFASEFPLELKYAVVSGAVAGGGLTVIANAPNPAGQSILKKYFKHGISPIRLLKFAIIPTAIVELCFLIF